MYEQKVWILEKNLKVIQNQNAVNNHIWIAAETLISVKKYQCQRNVGLLQALETFAHCFPEEVLQLQLKFALCVSRSLFYYIF